MQARSNFSFPVTHVLFLLVYDPRISPYTPFAYTSMSGRQGGKAKPLKAPKKQNKELDEDVSLDRGRKFEEERSLC